MIPAFNIAASGMLDAANRLNGTATSVARSTVDAQRRFADEAAMADQPAAPNAKASGPGSTANLSRPGGAPLYVPSMAEDAVAMRQAVTAYKANAKMLRTVADLAQALTDQTRPR